MDFPNFSFSITNINRQAIALFRRNHLYMYEGMWLKHVWHIFMPCLPIILYNILNVIGVFSDSSSTLPKAVAISAGITFYLIFSESILFSSSCLQVNKNYIVKSGVSFLSCYLASAYSVVMNFLVRYMVFTAMLMAYPELMTKKLLFGPAFALLILLFSIGIGAFLSVFVIFYKDISNVIQVLAFYLLFASGVFGKVDGSTVIGKIVGQFPSYIFVANGKNLILGESLVEWDKIIIILILTIIILVLAAWGNRNCKHLILDYLK